MADSKNDPKDVEMSEEVEDEEQPLAMDKATKKGLISKIMEDPSVLAHLQDQLHKSMENPSAYVESLPDSIKNRIKSLRKLQFDFTNMEAEFYQEVHELEKKYHNKHQNLYEKRQTVISGEHEPTTAECDYSLLPEDSEKDISLSEESEPKTDEEKPKTDEEKPKTTHGFEETTKGIPKFWLTIFKNVDLLAEMLQEDDEPVLEHLNDIKLKFIDEPMGFSLEFHFAENEFFTNKVLTKTYEMKCKPDDDDPFRFEGPEIIRCNGCTIDWKKDKNVTVKVIKKKQKHKTKNTIRTISKSIQRDSFFNFFNPPAIPDDDNEPIDAGIQSLLTADFEIGHYIRERVIPRAVLFFTGEALDDEDYDSDDEDQEGEEEQDDPDYEPPSAEDAKQDCKQQ